MAVGTNTHNNSNLGAEQLLAALRSHPELFLHLMGFTRKSDVYGEWMREMVFGKDDATIQAFRGSGKTTALSGSLALKCVLMPNRRMAFIRKTDTDVKEVMNQVQKMLTRPETQLIAQQVWGVPLYLTSCTQTEITTSLTSDPRGAAQLTGMGTSGSITGKHYDEIFTDDIVNPKDRVSRAERERTKQVYMELQNIKNRGGRILNTGTPWHVDDCFSIMPDPKKWDWRSMPEVISEEEVEHIRERISPALFAANYELRHIPSDDVIFTNPKTGASHEHVYHGICHVDAAYGGEDYTAFTAMRWDDGKLYVYGRLWRKHVSDVADQIRADHMRLMLGRMHMETNADKGYAARDFKEAGIPVAPYPESMNKAIKIETYGKQAWPDTVFVEGTDQDYINQICDWTEDAYHDDAPDSYASLSRVMLNQARNGDYKGILY